MTTVRNFLTLIEANSGFCGCKNLGLKLDDQQLRVSIGIRLCANICVAHTYHCGKSVERVFLPPRVLVFSHHATLSSLVKQTLGCLDLHSMLEPRGPYRTDGKRSGGVTMITCEMGKQMWDVTVVDALAPSRLKALYTTREPPPPTLKRVKLRIIAN